MAEIQEPYPIKPIWPTKPGKEEQKRRRRKPPVERETDRRQDGGEDSSKDGPRIDEYA